MIYKGFRIMHSAIMLNTPDPIILIISIARITLPIVALAFGVTILVVIPQYRKQETKKHKYSNMILGARITTFHGDHGVVDEMSENMIVIQHTDGRKIEITKQSIAHIHDEKS